MTAVSSRSSQRPAGLAEAAKWYRSELGWNVQAVSGAIRLRLSYGTVAFLAPQGLASDIFHARQRLELSGPVLSVRGERPYLVLLADTNDVVLSQADLPAGARLLRAPSSIVLPPSGGATAAAEWLAEPLPSQRWLPSAHAVLAALVAAITRAHSRVRP
jgi:hypothetical protein